jgi:hypothetical protein
MEVWPVIAMKSTAKGSVILNVVKDLTGDAHKILHYDQDDRRELP